MSKKHRRKRALDDTECFSMEAIVEAKEANYGGTGQGKEVSLALSDAVKEEMARCRYTCV